MGIQSAFRRADLKSSSFRVITFFLDPATLAEIRNGAERVVVQTREKNYQLGVRSVNQIGILGRMSVTDTGEVYHGMVGRGPSFSCDQAVVEIARLEDQTADLRAALAKLRAITGPL